MSPDDTQAEDGGVHGVAAGTLAAALAAVPAEQGVLVLMRHSLRERPEHDAPGFAAPLTAAGVALATAAGARLGRRPATLLSSPSPRCIETAAALARGAGAGQGGDVVEIDLLAEPRAFAQDLATAGPFFKAHGARAWVQGVISDPERVGARGAASGTGRILAALAGHAPGPGGLAIAVTHDTVLAVILHVLAHRQDRDEHLWPLMLEAALLWWDDAGVHWRWRDLAGHWRPEGPVAPQGPLC